MRIENFEDVAVGDLVVCKIFNHKNIIGIVYRTGSDVRIVYDDGDDITYVDDCMLFDECLYKIQGL